MKHRLSVLVCNNSRENIKSILQKHITRIDPNFEQNVSGKRVLIKPNIAGAFPYEQGATTSIEVTAAVISLVKDCGGISVVGDLPTVGIKALEQNGLTQLADELDCEILSSRFVTAHLGDLDIDIAYSLKSCDYFISLPKIKTHVLTGITGALKNTFGLVAPPDRKKLHLISDVTQFSEKLYDIYSCRPPDLVVADAILAMEGIGPTHGTPRVCNTLFIGNSGVAIDIFAAKMMGYDPASLPLLRIGMEKGFCNIEDIDVMQDPDTIAFWSRYIRVPIFEGARRIRFQQMAMGALTVDRNICQKCGACSSVCPANAIHIDEPIPFNFKKCVLCFCCLEMCPYGAIKTEKRLSK